MLRFRYTELLASNAAHRQAALGLTNSKAVRKLGKNKFQEYSPQRRFAQNQAAWLTRKGQSLTMVDNVNVAKAVNGLA